jgi:hypothetical protein
VVQKGQLLLFLPERHGDYRLARLAIQSWEIFSCASSNVVSLVRPDAHAQGRTRTPAYEANQLGHRAPQGPTAKPSISSGFLRNYRSINNPPPKSPRISIYMCAMSADQPEGQEALERLSSNVMNYLVWRYLQEAGASIQRIRHCALAAQELTLYFRLWQDS